MIKKTILLIEPGSRQTIYPPIGLMHLAAFLRDKYNLLIKDYSGEELDELQIKKDIQRSNAFIVGIRVLTGPPISRAIRVSKIAKDLNKIVVWGGPHPTILPEQTLQNENIDAVVIGEGEYSFLSLIQHYEGKRSVLKGIALKKKGKIVLAPPNKKTIDFRNLELPAWDLVENIEKYFPLKRNNAVPISTTRGCAFKCGFCHNSNANVKKYLGCYRIAPPQRAVEEYNLVKKLVKNRIEILDVGEDLHLVSKAYAKEFCETLKKNKLNIKWYTAARYSALDKETIDMIAKAGCKRILLGIESGSRRIQQMNNKEIDLNKAIEIAGLLRKKGIFVTNSYILGHPTETLQELKQTLEFIKKVPADENLIQLYRPMPGTPYFDLVNNSQKISVPHSLEEWSKFGVLGSDVNVSEVPSEFLFSTFYKVNAWQQSKYWFNQQRFYLKNNMFSSFFKNFVNNRFTFKLKEFLENKK